MSTPTPDQSATDPAFNAREQSSTLRQMDNQPVPETQAHINQRSHTGAIPAAKYETVGAPFDEPPSMSTIPREVPRAGPYQLDTTYPCSQAGLQECIKDLAACETARAKLAAENAALHKDKERLGLLLPLSTEQANFSS